MAKFSFKFSEREALDKVFTNKRTGLYTGVDPTAPSLHVGHMLPIMVLAWAFNWGYPVHFIVRLQELSVFRQWLTQSYS